MGDMFVICMNDYPIATAETERKASEAQKYIQRLWDLVEKAGDNHGSHRFIHTHNVPVVDSVQSFHRLFLTSGGANYQYILNNLMYRVDYPLASTLPIMNTEQAVAMFRGFRRTYPEIDAFIKRYNPFASEEPKPTHDYPQKYRIHQWAELNGVTNKRFRLSYYKRETGNDLFIHGGFQVFNTNKELIATLYVGTAGDLMPKVLAAYGFDVEKLEDSKPLADTIASESANAFKEAQEYACDLNHYDSDDFTPPESCEFILNDPQALEWLNSMLRHCASLSLSKFGEDPA